MGGQGRGAWGNGERMVTGEEFPSEMMRCSKIRLWWQLHSSGNILKVKENTLRCYSTGKDLITQKEELLPLSKQGAPPPPRMGWLPRISPKENHDLAGERGIRWKGRTMQLTLRRKRRRVNIKPVWGKGRWVNYCLQGKERDLATNCNQAHSPLCGSWWAA